jgi:hypothetical protein
MIEERELTAGESVMNDFSVTIIMGSMKSKWEDVQQVLRTSTYVVVVHVVENARVISLNGGQTGMLI